MTRKGRVSVVLLSLLVAAGIGLLLQPSDAGSQANQPQCAKPPGAQCGSKTIFVHADGLHGNDPETFVCGGDQVDWQVDSSGDVEDFTVDFDESPFDPNFGSGHYCGGTHCAGHQNGTDKLTAHTKSNDPGYVRCHKYTLTVVPTHGPSLTIDPHIIVATTGSAE